MRFVFVGVLRVSFHLLLGGRGAAAHLICAGSPAVFTAAFRPFSRNTCQNLHFLVLCFAGRFNCNIPIVSLSDVSAKPHNQGYSAVRCLQHAICCGVLSDMPSLSLVGVSHGKIGSAITADAAALTSRPASQQTSRLPDQQTTRPTVPAVTTSKQQYSP